jgi:hypothetical protein
VTISNISSVPAGPQAGGELQRLFESVSTSLRQNEESIRRGFTEGLDPQGKLFGLPPHIQRQFEVWDQTFTGGEERKLVEAMKKKMTEITLNTENYVKDAAQQKTAQFQLELAMRAANKTVSGIQQLLSAQ